MLVLKLPPEPKPIVWTSRIILFFWQATLIGIGQPQRRVPAAFTQDKLLRPKPYGMG